MEICKSDLLCMELFVSDIPFVFVSCSAATDEEFAAVVEKCGIQRIIDRFPEGLATRVGERGARLSGGERQKVAIARALLRQPSLLLCDEVTASVDSFSERDLVRTLRAAGANCTTITVAHKLSSIAHCDKILVLDSGVVAEVGTHAELVKKRDFFGNPGLYRRMWEAQHSTSSSEGGNGGSGSNNSNADKIDAVSS